MPFTNDPKRRRLDQYPCPGGGPRCKENCSKVFKSRQGLNGHLSTDKMECPVPDCPCKYSSLTGLHKHLRKKHPDYAKHNIRKYPSEKISFPIDIEHLISKDEYQMYVVKIRLTVRGDMRKHTGKHRHSDQDMVYTKQLHKSNVLRHQLAHKLLTTWLTENADRHDMIGGEITLGILPYSINILTHDRIDNSKPHFISLQNPFENIRIVPYHLNKRNSIIQLYGDNTVAEVRKLVLQHCPQTVNLETQIQNYKPLPKNNKKNLIYRQYSNYKGSKTCSFDEFQEVIFSLLRKQGGKCSISRIIMNFNYSGPKQFNLSVSRIDHTNSWSFDNLQLICSAFGNANGYKIDKDWFDNYFM